MLVDFHASPVYFEQMEPDIYTKLRNRLDELATGFPAAENGVELAILKRLFCREDAALFLELSLKPESVDSISRRFNGDPADLERRLHGMAGAGLIFSEQKNGQRRYAAIPFVIGIFELQINKLDRDLAVDLEDYYESVFGRTIQSFSTPVMRTIPVNRDIICKWPIAPYEDVLQIISRQETIAVAPCICRQKTTLAGKGCAAPRETCLVFGSQARFYVENGMGRFIDNDEARMIVTRSEEAGLVMQPFNAQKTGVLCSCCPCCCEMLRSLKMQPSPARAVRANYFARSNPELCIGCGNCIERCPMTAVKLTDEEIAVINRERCIGCGLCVTGCSSEAMALIRKSEEELYTPPVSLFRTYGEIDRERKRDQKMS